jgi:hypothetical protein
MTVRAQAKRWLVLDGILPFITVVLAINQLILTQEFGTTGTFRARLDETDQFRETVETDAGIETSPATPTAFLRTLVRAARDRAEALREATAAVDSPDRRDRLRGFAGRVVDGAEHADVALDGARFGSFDVVSVALDYDDVSQLDAVRALRTTRPAQGDPPGRRCRGRRRDRGAARGLPRRPARLPDGVRQAGTRRPLGRPAVRRFRRPARGQIHHPLVRGVVEATANVALLTALVASVVTLAVAPFAVLLAYVLRIATVARRTAADFGPFMLQREIPEDRLD